MRLLRSLLACGAASALQTSTAPPQRLTRRSANFLESFAEAFANPPLSAPRARLRRPTSSSGFVTDGWNGARVDADRCSQLIDALASMGGPFDASDLGGGLWLALHSRGPVPKWQKNQELLKVFGVRNRAGQTYFPKDKRVENYGEVVGNFVTFGAEGTFALPAGPLRAPCDLPVEIVAGGLTVFGKRFELPHRRARLVRVCVEIKISRRGRAELSRRPPRHLRGSWRHWLIFRPCEGTLPRLDDAHLRVAAEQQARGVGAGRRASEGDRNRPDLSHGRCLRIE